LSSRHLQRQLEELPVSLPLTRVCVQCVHEIVEKTSPFSNRLFKHFEMPLAVAWSICAGVYIFPLCIVSFRRIIFWKPHWVSKEITHSKFAFFVVISYNIYKILNSNKNPNRNRRHACLCRAKGTWSIFAKLRFAQQKWIFSLSISETRQHVRDIEWHDWLMTQIICAFNATWNISLFCMVVCFREIFYQWMNKNNIIFQTAEKNWCVWLDDVLC